METTGLSNNVGYRADVPVSPQVEQKPAIVAEQSVIKKVDAQAEVKQTELLQIDIERVNAALSHYGLGVNFDRDTETNRPIVRIIDRATDEVIKQYPTEGALQLMKNIQNYLIQQSGGASKQELTGALFNEII